MTTLNAISDRSPAEEILFVPDYATDRYAPFRLIPWWEPEAVQQSKIMVVGAGALGNEVLKNFALMGVGHLFVCDFDTIEQANLSRSILFRAKDNGRPKAEVAAESVKEINPDVQVRAFHGDINIELGLGVFRRMDVVIGCLDSREARLSINDFCWKVNKPWVDGAIEVLMGIARVFVPNSGTACYACLLTDQDWQVLRARRPCPWLMRKVTDLGKVPTTPTIASIIGAIQAQEALKLIHGKTVRPGTAVIFPGESNDAFLNEYPIQEECLSHVTFPEADLVELPGHRAATTTVRELLDLARSTMGDSQVALELGREIVVGLECRICGTQEPFFCPTRVPEEQAQCPSCQALRNAVLQHDIYGDEDFLDMTLAQIGIPPLDIIAARKAGDGYDYQYRYFELTGDADEMMRFS